MLSTYSGFTPRASYNVIGRKAPRQHYSATTAASARRCCKIDARVASWHAKSKAAVSIAANGDLRVEISSKSEPRRAFFIKFGSRDLQAYRLRDLQDRFDSIVSFRSDVPRDLICESLRAGLCVMQRNTRRAVS